MHADPSKIRALFLAAVEKHTPEQWPAYLDEACAGQPALRRRVEARSCKATLSPTAFSMLPKAAWPPAPSRR